MALIKCIECGNTISSFAEACPHCGCPAAYQGRENPHAEPSNETIHTEKSDKMRLRDQKKWDSIFFLVKQKRGQEALEETRRFIGKKRIADDIVMKMIMSKEIPVDYILENLPEQRLDPVKIETPSPTTSPTTRPCKACNKTISVKAEKCPHCGEPTGVRVCPRCGSTDVVILDAVSKAVSMALFGPLSINTVRSKYECWTCHFKF